MKTYKIPVIWQMYGYVTVEADSLTEAISEANCAPLPEDASYVENSFEVDEVGIDEVE
jgi:hypothetical protein